ncbi:nitrate reductase molybdenum cofactor assembly chaperone [Phenylobacterium sp.]|jgi:nitrate reductase delta subunit|uniref:nitrate reductase molybdenum cofactor assembly chaperone n=1 Tax=Phenylobacterium sp. TaxID=1871053 RepID=UPI000C8DAAA4|nr:nitrate reductase molybdenum cofactor assembly chaperone [Phenylobacterium sp.]MAK80941.1 nitrate reductase molybdenum cofactor assembly chaperone [Phenylobacterium sp.]|tara:strand:+ start:8299 stop:9006 length:708 start_codon:yes stop_codon:yes gene_type:complete
MARTYQALAHLLTYPTPDLQRLAPAALALIEAEAMVPKTIRKALGRLVDQISSGDIYDLQEGYTELFDRTRSLSLNLYEHVHGESRDRGEAMVALAELYRAHDLHLSANELPDFLPVFLEFLSTLPDPQAASLLGEATHVLDAMGERLKSRGSAYRAIFGALGKLASQAADPGALAALLSEPDEDPNDLEAIDKAWAETAVTFGPSDVGCPKATALVDAMMAEPGRQPRRTAANA